MTSPAHTPAKPAAPAAGRGLPAAQAARLTWRAARGLAQADVTRGRRGVALLIVMATVAILSSLSVSFAYNQRTNIWMSGNITAATRSYWAARGALNIAALAINARHNFKEMNTALALLGRSGRGANIEIWRQACEFTKIFCTGRASFFGMDLMDFTEEKGVGLHRGECSCEVSAEDGRVNLNAAAADTAAVMARAISEAGAGRPPSPPRGRKARGADQARNMLGLRLYGLLRPMLDTGQFDREEDIVQLILNVMDWTDADDTKTDVDPNGKFVEGGGGEDADYGRYGYDAKNAKMDTVGELQLVDGMTSEVYCKLRDKLTVFSTDKVNVNDADVLTLRGILCEAITDEQQRMAYCYNPTALGLQPMDEALVALESCRQLKKAVFSTPFATMGRFTQFFRQYSALANGVPMPLNNAVVNAELGVKTKMVRLVATGRHCWDRECRGICVGGGGGEREAGGDREAGGRVRCKSDKDCGGGYCSKRFSERKLTAVFDTSTGAIVNFQVN